ncbi:SCO4225 family membrane protein [Streptomyces megasporus]|uniref:SCO4225 family membrane protein n=1 Tax=Streptomyces megasporus TaxID=44060 RepID=UPI0004E18E68|nr:hypothetical protein [Streptomyces megasporus]
MKPKEKPGRIVSEATGNRTSRVYLAVVAVLALWASADALGVVDDPDSTARFLAVVLCMPWTLVVYLVVWVVRVDLWLGYNVYFESPTWLFEPLWTVFWLLAALANARIIAALSRSASRSGRSSWAVPLGVPVFFTLIIVIWRV